MELEIELAVTDREFAKELSETHPELLTDDFQNNATRLKNLSLYSPDTNASARLILKVLLTDEDIEAGTTTPSQAWKDIQNSCDVIFWVSRVELLFIA